MKKCHCPSPVPDDRAIDLALLRGEDKRLIRESELSMEKFWVGVPGREFYPEVSSDLPVNAAPPVITESTYLELGNSLIPEKGMAPRGVLKVCCKNKG